MSTCSSTRPYTLAPLQEHLGPRIVPINPDAPIDVVYQENESTEIVTLDIVPSTNNTKSDQVVVQAVRPDKVKSIGQLNWEYMEPKKKQELSVLGQQKAINNKYKHEGKQARRQRDLLFMEQRVREKAEEKKVRRPIPFNQRVPMNVYTKGMEVPGTVISMAWYGAYIDIGTTRDCLLHVSQMSRDFFVEKPRDMLELGQEVTVKILDVNLETDKISLTFLEKQDIEDENERLDFGMLEENDELWGVVKRITEYGAYVEVDAVVHGFVHFMDHPLWDGAKTPAELFTIGQKVRVWVLKLEEEKQRIALTALRPDELPGPRFEQFKPEYYPHLYAR
eukprot:Nitzschia sp. Nitz4//scaffold12_size214221//152322//153406//NITZ4_001519-RA/size214221-augustus-gene-0.32-mRNA-1//-1//CDS//3329535077//7903//frame0